MLYWCNANSILFTDINLDFGHFVATHKGLLLECEYHLHETVIGLHLYHFALYRLKWGYIFDNGMFLIDY